MKRTGNLYQDIISIENLKLADQIARRGKSKQYGVINHDRNREANILALHDMLKNKTFTTGTYTKFMIHDPKPREISALDYFPDRIVHHAIMNRLEPMFVASFTADTYSCIKGRGIHACHTKIQRALRKECETRYYLQLDVRKFYPSVDHDILKQLLRRKIKDNDLLWLLDNIIDSAPGVPIGNYLSQYFANFYLSGPDHFIKDTLGVKYYFRYADDMLILAGDKAYLHRLREQIRAYLSVNLKLEIKPNDKVKPVDDHGINILGFVYRHTHIRLRKTLKKSWARAVKHRRNRQSIAAFEGWAGHCDSRHLIKKLTDEYLQRTGHQVKKPGGKENRD